MPDCNTPEENQVVNRARQYMATYENMAELIRLGAYRRGSDVAVDESINFYPGIENFLSQNIDETTPLASCYEQLRDILRMPVESSHSTEAPVSYQSVPHEELTQDINETQQDSDSVNEPDQIVSDQTLSIDTLSGLNSMGDN